MTTQRPLHVQGEEFWSDIWNDLGSIAAFNHDHQEGQPLSSTTTSQHFSQEAASAQPLSEHLGIYFVILPAY